MKRIIEKQIKSNDPRLTVFKCASVRGYASRHNGKRAIWQSFSRVLIEDRDFKII